MGNIIPNLFMNQSQTCPFVIPNNWANINFECLKETNNGVYLKESNSWIHNTDFRPL